MTVPVTDYDSLTAAISDAAERSYTAGELDRFIGLAEGAFRLYFGPSFARQATATVSFVDGSGALPAGFIRVIALTNATYGALEARGIEVVREWRISGGGIPAVFAITGTTIEVAPVYTGDLTLDYEGTLAGLSSSNPTNWLIAAAPQVYLSMCLSYEKAYQEDYQGAAALRSEALQQLAAVNMQAIVGQFGRAGVSIPGATP